MKIKNVSLKYFGNVKQVDLSLCFQITDLGLRYSKGVPK